MPCMRSLKPPPVPSPGQFSAGRQPKAHAHGISTPAKTTRRTSCAHSQTAKIWPPYSSRFSLLKILITAPKIARTTGFKYRALCEVVTSCCVHHAVRSVTSNDLYKDGSCRPTALLPINARDGVLSYSSRGRVKRQGGQASPRPKMLFDTAALRRKGIYTGSGGGIQDGYHFCSFLPQSLLHSVQ